MTASRLLREPETHVAAPRRLSAPRRSAFRSIVLRRLAQINDGHVTLREGSLVRSVGVPGAALTAEITVHDARFYRSTVLGGSLGAAEAFIAGWWTTNDLTTLLRIFVRAMDAADRLERGPARLGLLLANVLHRLRPNTRRGSRRNIFAHYDLGNEFFALFLDSTMSYSCGIFERESATLEDASVVKLDCICRKLALRREDHLLEIGTGWGGLAVHAASRYGCRVTTTTISREQHALAGERIRAAGLSDRITLLLSDYRDLRGTFDKLVSVEMIEAVGHRNLPTFFEVCGNRLRRDGAMLLQAITMPDHRYERYRKSADFIQHYIFPGSCVPSMTAMLSAMSRSSTLQVRHMEEIGPHYAKTLRCWRESFMHRAEDLRVMGFTEAFMRCWEYYFCYCEAGFEERYIGNAHLLLAHTGSRFGAATDGSA